METVMKVVDGVSNAIPDAITKHLPMEVPPQSQSKPGAESEMNPRPQYIRDNYKGSGKLQDKVAIITGGDSGIGRAVAVHFAREGADVAILHLPEEESDAAETVRLVQAEGRRCITIAGDVSKKQVCEEAVARTISTFQKLDILVNNAATQTWRNSISEVPPEELETIFNVNIIGYFYMAQAALKHLKEGGSIINTTSVVAYKGMPQLLVYSCTKGAITSFTRSLSQELVSKGIRVNGVAPGPIWTPFLPTTMPKDAQVAAGKSVPMGRHGQPCEMAPSYVLLASEDGSYYTGQVLHPNGGTVVNG